MRMPYRNSYWLFPTIFITTWISISYGCQMEGVTTWFTPVTTTVLDTHSGSFFNRATTNIVGINSITYGEGLNSGPYVQVTHSNAVFDITTNDAYGSYEENETSQSMTFTVVFGCTGGSTGTLVFIVNVIDTNNNPPQFLPNNQFEFTVTPPLPPGYQITGCLQDITVRDIDLTTQRIDFAIEPNEYFEIDYDASLSVNPKEFKAVLRTTTFIMALSEPFDLTISATDVDSTGDPPITTSATIRITPDSAFQFPEEPVFSQPYYMARYKDNQVTLDEPIKLQQGFHELVNFSLEGDYLSYFDLLIDGNQLSLAVIEPLSPELLREGQLVLALRAAREFTSGATATVVMKLPEGLLFEKPLYESKVVDDTMEPLPLVLAQGYEGGFSVNFTGDFSAFFTTTVHENIITLSLNAPPNSIQSSSISLQVSAFNDFSTASAVVTLEVIRDDLTTPAFEKAIYTGAYGPESGLSLEPIGLIQGYDETVSFSLEGEHASYFEVSQNSPVLSIIASPLPAQVLSEQNLILSLRVAKPRTVGANAALYIALPPARELNFQSSTYIGSIQENNLVLAPIIMDIGYGDDISFSLSGDYAMYFTVSNVLNQISLIQSTPLPEDVISSEDFLIITLSASGELTLTASTVVILEIVKHDTNTPAFGQSIYVGKYSEFNLEIETISLVQGYDSSVSFRLEGDYANYFDISDSENNNIFITMASNIPEELIINEKVILFNVIADKPLTVGANAAVAIRFPPQLTELTALKFAQNTYIGSVENNILALDSIILESGYKIGTEFTLAGAYASHFTFSSSENVVTIAIQEPLPSEVLQTNDYLILELGAERHQAVSAVTSIIIDLMLPEVKQPVFGQPYYRGIYTEDSGLQMEQEINLAQGFDENVTFSLNGDSSQWFILSTSGESVTLEVNGNIPSQVIESNHQLLFTIVATKLGTPPGETVISIELPKDINPVVLRFEQNSYVGRIENGELQSPAMTLLGENIQQLQLTISGEYASYFTLTQESNNVLLQLNGTLPNDIQESFIVLNIETSTPNAVPGYTTVVIEIVKEPAMVRPVFEQAYYVGEYSEEDGLVFDHNIQLIDGFDESVSFTVEGDDAQWFEINYNENESLSLTLKNSGALPVEHRSQLIFSVVANNINMLIGRAAIVIILTDYPQTASLLFSQTFYKGTIGNGNLTIDAISLDGYSSETDITIAGDYVNYFQLLNEDGALSIELIMPLPNDVTESNTVLILTLEAQTPTTSTRATIVIELLKNQINSLTFEEIYYVGSYSESSNLMFESEISLASGYEGSVSFYLEGDDAQWFEINQNGNSVSLLMTAPIPQEVLLSRRSLIFIILAEKPGSVPVKASIIIELLDDVTEFKLLGFNKINYVGLIENNQVDLEHIILNENYTENVIFTLLGGLAFHFNILNEDGKITIVLEDAIPEEAIPENRIIILEIQASAPQYMSAYATIVFEVKKDEVLEDLLFSNVYYTGKYTEDGGLIFGDISLSQGFDENVIFDLEGDQSQWFGLQTSDNVVTLTLISPIPPAVLLNNQQLVFIVTARKPDSSSSRATVVISLLDELTEDSVLGFNKISYLGTIDNNQVNLEPVVVAEGYNENVAFTLHGDFANYFVISSEEEAVTITLQNTLPEESIQTKQIIVLEIQASAPQYISAYATVVLEVLDNNSISEEFAFTELYYMGQYVEGELKVDSISLSQSFDGTVEFSLEGENTQWFNLIVLDNSVTLTVSNIPQEILESNQNLIFTIIAEKPGSITARAVVIVSILSEFTLLRFNKISYVGSIENDQVDLEHVILIESYMENLTFTLLGDLASHFNILNEDGIITIVLENGISEEIIPENRIIILEIQASAPQYISAYATIVLEIRKDEVLGQGLIFSKVYYTGKYTEEEGLIFGDISLSQGFDENVIFDLEDEQSQWFGLQTSENFVTLTLISPIPSAVLFNNQQLVFIVKAQKPETSSARATVVISLLDELTEVSVLGFNKISYLGTIDNDQVHLEPVVVTEGYNENVTFTLHGDLANYFIISSEEETVTITLQNSLPEESVQIKQIIVLEIKASAPQYVSGYATVVFELLNNSISEEFAFTELYYMARYIEGELIINGSISLSQDFNGTVEFLLEGDNTQWFNLVVIDNSVTLIVSDIPQEILEITHNFIFTIVAEKPGSPIARAVIIVSILSDGEATPGVSFERALYEGVVREGQVLHEAITLSGYDGTEIQVFGTYAELFVASVTEGWVTVQVVSSVTLAPDVVYVALELRALTASTVLLLDIEHEETILPTVTFGSSTYSITIDVSRTGFLGRVEATASNGEAVSYSLLTQDDHLSQRISVNQEGELHLSAPANSGMYSFEVVATTVFSSVSGSAVVQLTVDVIAETGDDKVVPPLIILDRNEEEPHKDLVILNEEHAGCRYSLTNHWPVNKTWLYVDDTGLHANVIDREDPSIALMALSQIQVELLLECDTDNNDSIVIADSIMTARNKRAIKPKTSTNHLGPYDYGDMSWILTDSILYNSRRTLVNLIVNDINDNDPIFVGKDQEPITVGYPIAELEERVSPRALIELQATDADVGENAALLYWSSAEVLAVSPSSGLVHVRQNAQLEDGDTLLVFATDQNGQGRTGNLTILVKLLDVTNIAVVTVRDAFLEDEQAILENFKTIVGYEVKALRATVISDDPIDSEIASRRKRDVTTFGASLQIYVYGLIEREPVLVDRLTTDLTNDRITTVTITRTVSLEDHLEEMRDSSGRDTALLVATIVLSVLLFILIVLAAVWFFLKWRKQRNYEKFQDEISVVSLDEPGEVPKQTEVMPRLNIEELKKSERRLQERLEAPDVTVEPINLQRQHTLPSSTESVTVPMPDTRASIVIQDKLKDPGNESDDEDEFGERKTSRRKSVVTFNEKVEKIIHVESSTTSDDESSIHEVYKF